MTPTDAPSSSIARHTAPPAWLKAMAATAPDRLPLQQSPKYAHLLQALGQGLPAWYAPANATDATPYLLTLRTSMIRGYFLGWPLERLGERVMRFCLPSYDAQGGPVDLLPDADPARLADLVRTAAAEAERRGAVRIRGAFSPTLAEKRQAAIAACLEATGFRIERWGTFVIPLGTDEDRMMKGLSSTTRNLVRKSAKLGMGFEPLLPDMAAAYARAFLRTRKRAGIRGGMWDPRHLGKMRATGADVTFHVARHADGSILAGEMILRHGNTIRSFSPWQDERAHAEKLPAQYGLRWDIMQRYAAAGATRYDLAGVHPSPPPKSKDAGIRHFKSKWGGDYLEYIRYEKRFAAPGISFFQRFAKSL